MTQLNAVAKRDLAIGYLCGILVVVLFSCFILVSRLGFKTSLKLPDIAAIRFGIAGLLMFPLLMRYGLKGIRLRDAAALAFTGGLGFALFAYTGFYLAPASHGAVLLHGTLPLFAFILAWLFTSATVSTRKAVGLVAIYFGIMAMVSDSLGGSTKLQILGDASLLLASICWSTYGLLARRFGLAPAHSAAIVTVMSMVCFLPVYALLPDKAIFTASWTELLIQGLFQGVLIGVVSIFVYSKAVATLGSVETALFIAAVPVITGIAAVFLLNEIPSLVAVSGIVIVSAGMAFSMYTPKKATTKQQPSQHSQTAVGDSSCLHR